MASFCLMYFIFLTACEMGRSLTIGLPSHDRAGCLAVVSAVKGTSFWKADADRKVIQWYRPLDRPRKVAPCSCGSGGGDVSSITIQVEDVMIWNGVCSDCPGQEVSDTEYQFSTDDPVHGTKTKIFGPCPGITISRCSCSGTPIANAKTEATRVTKTSDATEATEATGAAEATEATGATEATEATGATEATEAPGENEATNMDESTPPTEMSQLPTEAP